ncbi:MAG: methyl-accepting chemotaxis protein [Planctomycetota bacterium]|nr:methyl-accepting chemotaxis protein [Planctomycetota bacterium]
MSIRLKLILGALFFLLLFVAVFVVTSSVTSDQKSDAVTISLASRQRMLAERMSKELLAYAEDPAEETWAALAGTSMTFQATHRALLKGGRAPNDMLVPASNEDTGELIPLKDGLTPAHVSATDIPAAVDAINRKHLELVDAQYKSFTSAAGGVKTAARDAKDQGDLIVFQIPQVMSRLESALTRAVEAARSDILNDDAKNELIKVTRYVSRQRLIAQHLGTLALNFLRRPMPEEREELRAGIALFQECHESLTNGGPIVIDLEDPDSTELLAGAVDSRLLERLLDVTSAWNELRGMLDRLQTAGTESAGALERALRQTPLIVEAMGHVVDREQILSEQHVETIQNVQVVALVLCFLCVLVAALLGNRIGKNVNEAVGMARTIAAGDLTQRCHRLRSKDETGQLVTSLNTMSQHLSDLVERVQQSGTAVNASAGQIAASSRQQESTVSELAATATEIAATSTEISATASELLETMQRVSDVSSHAAVAAGEGKECIEQMRSTMDRMVESTGSITTRLAAISEKTAKISTVVTTIMKIAQQTNLISLNAAIEAENAGELGLGFAVVAKEVRRLADQTSKASQGIEQMVKEMQSAVATAVMGMDGFSEDIRNGTTATQAVTGQLGSIIDQIQHLAPQFDSVREGMSAQATGAIQIAEGVRQIVASSEETADSVRQTTAAIDGLAAAARELQDGVSRFKVSATTY